MENKPQVYIRSGYKGNKPTAEVTIKDKKYVLEMDYIEEILEQLIDRQGYTVSQTTRQKYPRLIIKI